MPSGGCFPARFSQRCMHGWLQVAACSWHVRIPLPKDTNVLFWSSRVDHGVVHHLRPPFHRQLRMQSRQTACACCASIGLSYTRSEVTSELRHAFQLCVFESAVGCGAEKPIPNAVPSASDTSRESATSLATPRRSHLSRRVDIVLPSRRTPFRLSTLILDPASTDHSHNKYREHDRVSRHVGVSRLAAHPALSFRLFLSITSQHPLSAHASAVYGLHAPRWLLWPMAFA